MNNIRFSILVFDGCLEWCNDKWQHFIIIIIMYLDSGYITCYSFCCCTRCGALISTICKYHFHTVNIVTPHSITLSEGQNLKSWEEEGRRGIVWYTTVTQTTRQNVTRCPAGPSPDQSESNGKRRTDIYGKSVTSWGKIHLIYSQHTRKS